MTSPTPDIQTMFSRPNIPALAEELETNAQFRARVMNIAESINTPPPTDVSPPINGFTTSPRKRALPDDGIADDHGKMEISLAEATTPSKDGVDENRAEKPLPNSASPKFTKKRKLTNAEKEEKQREREEREQQRAEKKLKLEEERRVKEEERQKKAADRDEKKKLKEAELKAKEDKKREEDEEKAKKERAQTRLNTFFPTLKVSPKKTPTDCSEKNDSTSIPGAVPSSNTSGNSTPTRSLSPQKSAQQPAQSEYESVFLPFFVQAHVVLAPWNRFGCIRNHQLISREIDKFLQNGDLPTDQDLPGKNRIEGSLWPTRWTKSQWARYKSYASVKELLGVITGSIEKPIDLTNSTYSKTVASPAEVLKKVPIKHLQYAEDLRPAYRGTFSRLPPARSALRLGKNPFEKALPDIDYEYDSEAEWVEPEEGEDLDSEGEEDAGSDEDDDDMEEFLDDEGLDPGASNPGNKRRVVHGDLTPICSGLRWEDVQGVNKLADISGSQSNSEFGNFRMELLLDDSQLPIDPYSASYWHKSAVPNATPTIKCEGSKDAARKGLYPMDPPRVPLHAINRANATVNQLTLVDSTGKAFPGTSNSSKSGKRMISSEYLDEFKRAVQGSDLTKIGLIEVLKKRFPKSSKDVIKDTLDAVASRVGAKEADKRWTLIDGI